MRRSGRICAVKESEAATRPQCWAFLRGARLTTFTPKKCWAWSRRRRTPKPLNTASTPRGMSRTLTRSAPVTRWRISTRPLRTGACMETWTGSSTRPGKDRRTSRKSVPMSFLSARRPTITTGTLYRFSIRRKSSTTSDWCRRRKGQTWRCFTSLPASRRFSRSSATTTRSTICRFTSGSGGRSTLKATKHRLQFAKQT